jgi:hypothetical protein
MIKVLILNGSTPATIQVLDILDTKKYQVAICDPNPFCWARFHFHCSEFVRAPRLKNNPKIYLQFLLKLIQKEKFDVVLPVHEEGLLLAANKKEIFKYTNFLLGSAENFHTIMNKKSFLELTKSLNLPVPKMAFVKNIEDVAIAGIFPCWVKLPYGTSSTGVVRIANEKIVKEKLKEFGSDSDFIIQEEIIGDQLTIQALFQNGNLICSHQYQALSTGFGGGASKRISVNYSELKIYAKKIGKKLSWSGPLMIDAIRDQKSGTIYIIEGNPRIGEISSAFLAGLNIPEAYIKLTCKEKLEKVFETKSGIKSHQMFTEITGAIKRSECLWKKYQRAFQATFLLGEYKSSVDEFIHPSVDPVSVLFTFGIFLSLPFLTETRIKNGNQKSAASLPATTIKEILKND